MKTYSMLLTCLMILLGVNSLSSAAIVTDPVGDTIAGGPTDITAVQAAQLTRLDGQVLLKVSLTATPNIGGIVVFEADVDSSTGTGGVLSMTGIPVSPCPCKTTAGMDVVVLMVNRMQDANSSSAMCEGCVESTNAATSCSKARWPGEWYSVASSLASNTTGVIRGFSDPQPLYTRTSKCYTFPWDSILVYTRTEVTNPAEQYTYADGLDRTTTKWQVSVWTDPAYASGNEDDFANGTTLFNISDVVPNGDGNLVMGLDDDVLIGSHVGAYCEGNFDGDADIDGTDASKFKTDFGRSAVKNPCPSCNAYY